MDLELQKKVATGAVGGVAGADTLKLANGAKTIIEKGMAQTGNNITPLTQTVRQ